MADPTTPTREGGPASRLDRGETRRMGDPIAAGPTVHAASDQPRTIDRYLVLGPLGSGGMGVVYAAYDPVLDRKVALKLLHTSKQDEQAKTEGRTRLVREAQAIARLNHPNVVAVFDVGTVDDRVYMATEFLDGVSLKRWCKQAPRSRREILGVFVQAGRGLAAAHAAGLVHRDFKPANVLVPVDGRVRVLDFGLARASAAVAPDEDAGSEEPAPARARRPAQTGLLGSSLTLSGTILGTPAYMSPEQHRNDPTDARTDQFSFCVALWEALHGQRPFGGGEYEDLRAAVLDGRILEPPDTAEVPGRLRRVLRRGLSLRADDRWPSMNALLHELERDPAAQWRRGLVAAATLGLVGTLAVQAWAPTDAPRLCTGAAEHLAGTWNAATREGVREAFAATHQVYGAAAFDGVVAALDDYGERWTAMHADACEAHHVRGEQSAQLMDRRMLCLERRRAEMAALVGVLVDEADPKVVENAVQAAQGLPDLDACADLEALARPTATPDDASTREVDEIRSVLARATALWRAAKYPAAREATQAAVERARELGVWSLTAEALSLHARLLDSTGEPKQAEQVLYEALSAAERGESDPLRAELWTQLVWVVGHQLGRPDAVAALESQASATIERTRTEETRATLLQHMAVVHSGQGRHAEAVENMQRSIDLVRARSSQDSLRMAGMENRMGAILFSSGDYAGALPHFQTALEGRRHALGPDHPLVAHSLGGIALVHFTQGDFERALTQYEQAQAILERAVEPDSVELARGYINLGGVHARLGRYDRALELHTKAETICKKKLGVEHPLTASATFTLGQDLAGLERFDPALEKYREALATWEKVLGPEHPQLGHALTGIGMIHAGRAQWSDAIAALERAHEIRKASEEQDPSLLAETDFALAQALNAPGPTRDRARARELSAGAAEGYRRGGPAHAQALATVENWRATHD